MKPHFCLILFLFFSCLNPIEADDEQADATAIHLSTETQNLAGLQTVVLKTAQHQSEFLANGKAVNIQALLTLRNRYRVSLTESQRTQALLHHSEQNTQRLQELYEHGATAKRNLQAQQSQLQTEQAQFEGSHIQSQAIVDELRLNWGNTLTDWALSSSATPLNRFLAGQETLVLITLPVGKSLPESHQQIAIDATGNRSKAQTATFISAAPQPESNVSGEYYFFQTNGAHIKPGMRVSAWLPEQLQQSGVIIPQSALIWHMNQAYVYLKTAENTFVKQVISDFSPTTDGYFVNSGLQAGQTIVSSGAQLLLSDEIRGQIPDDD